MSVMCYRFAKAFHKYYVIYPRKRYTKEHSNWEMLELYIKEWITNIILISQERLQEWLCAKVKFCWVKMIPSYFVFVYEIYKEWCLSKGISRILKMSEDDCKPDMEFWNATKSEIKTKKIFSIGLNLEENYYIVSTNN